MNRSIGHLVAREVNDPVTALAKADQNIVSEADVLEALVYLADPKVEYRQIAKQALQVFGSVGAVLSARIPDLTIKLGIRHETAYALRAIHMGMRSVLKEPNRERVPIGSFTQLIGYLGDSLKHKAVEVLRILYLDRKNGLISDEEANRGALDVPIYAHDIVRRALELGASAVVMAQSHRSGDPVPSEADVSLSQQVQRSLSVMNIALHDSLVIGERGVTSLRSSGRL